MKRIYTRGDEAEFTGKACYLSGALFYQYKLIEGHRKGETIVTYMEKPDPGDPVTIVQKGEL